MSLLGNPFATATRQGPSVSGDFLGLVDDFNPILDEQRIHVWVRERLQVKIQDLILIAKLANQLRPATAAKLYGCVTFLDQAVFGKIARAAVLSLEPRRMVFLSLSFSSPYSGRARRSTRCNHWVRRFPAQYQQFS